MDEAVCTTGLVKHFGGRPHGRGAVRAGLVRALDGMDLTVRTGEIHGFLGPNGAGKTTTLRILLGLLRSDGGNASVLEGDPWRDAVSLHRRIAYVPGDVALWPHLSGGETIDLLARLRGVRLQDRRRNELIARFDLDPTKQARTYSRGNRQKVALVAALAGDAELLLLDEPSSGLDPLMEAEFRACLQDVRRSGRTVLLSSHVLAEVEAICDRVTIIRDGRAIEAGSLAELRHLTRTSVTVVTQSPVDGIEQLAGVHDVQIDGTQLRCQVDTGAMDALLLRLGQVGVHSLESRPPTLEELFLRHYEVRGGSKS